MSTSRAVSAWDVKHALEGRLWRLSARDPLRPSYARHLAGEPVSRLEFNALWSKYMQSSMWQRRTVGVLRDTNGLCEDCGREATDVHHKHYRTRFRESRDDLQALCRSCHARISEQRRFGRPA